MKKSWSLRFLSESIIVGYLLAGRSFAYVGIIPVFPAELLLFWATLVGRGTAWRIFGAGLARLQLLEVALILFLSWGIVALLRGIADDPLLSFKNFATHYFPFLFFVGIAAGKGLTLKQHRRFLIIASCVVGFAGSFLSLVIGEDGTGAPLVYSLPWAPGIPLFHGPQFSPLLLVSVLALTTVGIDRATLLSLCALGAVMLVYPARALWLAAFLGILVVAWLDRGRGAVLKLIAVFIGIGAAIAAVLLLFGDQLTIHPGRGGTTVSLLAIIGRFIAVFDPDLAFDLVADSGDVAGAYHMYITNATSGWRLVFWKNVIDSLDSTATWMAGHGYGMSLGAFLNYPGDFIETRTPHNFIVLFLGYTGLVGVGLSLLLLYAFFRLFARLPASPLRTMLLGQHVVFCVNAMFTGSFETPYVAAPYFLLSGMTFAAALAAAPAAVRAPRGHSAILGGVPTVSAAVGRG